MYFEGDLFAFSRVCRNLIMNAFQATPPRGRVVVRTLRQNERAIIEIADTGCGIPPERLGSIFDDFATTKRRGLGLGLAVSKRMVEQLGGTIAVTSQVGLGSTFTLSFPLTKARPSQLQAV
jgi:signal transduction histidine kinase